MTDTDRACRRPLHHLVAAAAAAVTLVLVAATADEVAPSQPPNSIGIRLADVSEGQEDDPRAKGAIIAHVQPGGRVTRHLDVVSTLDRPVEVEVYGGNGVINGGDFAPDNRDRPGVADWVSVSSPRLSLEPMGVEQVEVAIDVPTGAPLGEQYGYVWVEPPASEGEISIANRVGMRVYLSVGTGEEPPVDFRIGSVTAAKDSDGVPVVNARLRNTGGRALDISGDLSLSEGPAGLTAGPFPFDDLVSLRPGDIGDITFRLDPELPNGPWLATITAQSGLLERTAEAEISFPSSAGQEAAPAESETIGGSDAEGNDISERLRGQRRALLPLAAILILFALGSLWLMLMWKRREDDEADRAQEVAKAPTGVSGDVDGSG